MTAPVAVTVTAAPLADVPIRAAPPLRRTTVRVSPASGSESLASRPGAATLRTVSSSVPSASAAADGASLTGWTPTPRPAAALAVPPPSVTVTVTVRVAVAGASPVVANVTARRAAW